MRKIKPEPSESINKLRLHTRDGQMTSTIPRPPSSFPCLCSDVFQLLCLAAPPRGRGKRDPTPKQLLRFPAFGGGYRSRTRRGYYHIINEAHNVPRQPATCNLSVRDSRSVVVCTCLGSSGHVRSCDARSYWILEEGWMT